MAGPLRIMIVEDELLVAMEIEHIVEELGHLVIGVATETEGALALASQGRVDVAFVDLHLRDGLTGPEIGRRLAREHGVLVIFCTANPNLAPADTPGIVGVIAKPFFSSTMERAIRAANERLTGEGPR